MDISLLPITYKVLARIQCEPLKLGAKAVSGLVNLPSTTIPSPGKTQ